MAAGHETHLATRAFRHAGKPPHCFDTLAYFPLGFLLGKVQIFALNSHKPILIPRIVYYAGPNTRFHPFWAATETKTQYAPHENDCVSTIANPFD